MKKSGKGGSRTATGLHFERGKDILSLLSQAKATLLKVTLSIFRSRSGQKLS
jgi:hypothetical protein